MRVPLIAPYRLAFGVVEYLDTILVRMIDADGHTGFGEGTILTGYSDETIDRSWQAAKQFGERLLSLHSSTFQGEVAGFGVNFPFAATAFGTALEMLEDSPALQANEAMRVPLVGLISAKDEAGIEREFEHQYKAGYRTFKVKVGFEAQKDGVHVKAVQRIVRGKGLIRIDANQGYTAEEGQAFVRSLDPTDIELFEQPCQAGDWPSHLAVASHCPVPMMLDESIHGIAEIEKSASLRAAAYIKLKLMKLVTLRDLELAILRIKSLGMTPVLGNGVACDIGCWKEACISARHIDNAGEMNGHLKTRARFLSRELGFDNGALTIERGFAPGLDLTEVEKHHVESATYDKSRVA